MTTKRNAITQKLAAADIGAFFRPSEVAAHGVSSHDLQRLVDDGIAERVCRGLYRLKSAEPTERYSIAAVCARVPSAIVCLLSALQVHELGTQLPRAVWIAIPNKARAPRIPEFSVRVVRFSGASLKYGVEPAEFEGVAAKITNPARTIVDCFRFQRLIGREAAVEAFRDALRKRIVTTNQIWRAAEACRARSLVGPVLESLSV